MDCLTALDLIASAPQKRNACALGGEVAAALGFDSYSYSDCHSGRQISSPSEWGLRYRDRHYERVDPIVHRVRAVRRAVSWSLSEAIAQSDHRTIKILSESAEYGAQRGINIPIFGGFGRYSTICFSGPDESVEADWEHELPLLYMIAARFDDFVQNQRVEDDAETAFLTAAETRCLTWLAKGKTMSEAATIVKLTRRTVEFHVTNARRKLNAATIPQAVAEAVRSGLIH